MSKGKINKPFFVSECLLNPWILNLNVRNNSHYNCNDENTKKWKPP